MKSTIYKAAFFLLLALSGQQALATDRNFVFTHESRTLQGGLRELEVWLGYNYGREDFYSAVLNRLEFEIGLGKRLQTSFYLNLKAATSPFTVYNPITDENGEIFFQEQKILQTNFDIGFSNEWKFQISDPIANKIGSALYAEITIAPHEYELEGKLILDKKFNRFITALNLVGELELEAEEEEGETEWERESKFEIDYGLVYQLPKNFAFGFEARSSNVIHEGEVEHSALFAGPVFSYRQNDWWLSLGIQPQITDFTSRGLSLEDHEKLNTRMIFSYSF